MKLRAALFSLVGLVAAASPAHAIHRGAVTLQAPILQAVSVPYGLKTPSGRGSVRLSSVDVTTTAVHPQTFSGLDMWIGGTPCATWSQTFVSGRSSADFNLIAANTPEGVNAQTPNATSTGAGNATGNYGFSVSCKDANGNSSNTVNLTYVGVTNAVNIGTTDRTDFGVVPAGFGNIAGAQVLLSVGGDWHNSTNLSSMRFNGAFANLVTITPADTSRRPYIVSINTGGTMDNYRATDIVESGVVAPANGSLNLMSGWSNNAATNIQWDHIHGFYSEAMLGTNSALGAFSGTCATAGSCGLTDSDFEYIETGTSPGGNLTIQRVNFRYFYNNCIFLGNIFNTSFLDDMCIAPNIAAGGLHTDNMQVSDGATPVGLTIQRFLAAQADGSDQAQGVIFGGALLNITGYVDDGTTGHGPGTILTRVTGGYDTGNSGSRIVTAAGTTNGFDATAAVTMTCTVTNCNQVSVQLNNLAPTNIGSPAAPVHFYGSGIVNLHIDGIINNQATFHGFASNGEAGTSYVRDMMYFQQDANPHLQSSWTGSIHVTGTTTAILTMTTGLSSNIPTEAPYLGGRMQYTGCNYCGTSSIGTIISGTPGGPATYNMTVASGSVDVSSEVMNNSDGYPITGGVWINQFNCAIAEAHSGTFQIGPGYGQGSYFAGTFGDPCPPANTTLSHFFGNAPNTLTGADFASGQTPQAYTQAITWQGQTPAQILTKNCLAAKGKIGGKLDGGSGLWWNAVTGETDAVAHTGGGNWTINNGQDSGVHIPGCEAAP